MKKMIALAVAGVLMSGAAAAGPGHQHGHKHGHKHAYKHGYRHAQAHNSYGHYGHFRGHVRGSHHSPDFGKGLAAFAILAGTAIAIDAALDDNNHGKPHHNGYGNNHASKPQKPRPQAVKPLRDRKFTISERQKIQHKRIAHGVRNGELAPKEAKRLRKQQARIAGQEHNFRADGKFTKKERQIIHARLDNASEKIRRLKHNEWARR